MRRRAVSLACALDRLHGDPTPVQCTKKRSNVCRENLAREAVEARACNPSLERE